MWQLKRYIVIPSFFLCDCAYTCLLPVFVYVKCQSSDLCPVFSQLSVTDHGHHADDVDNRVFRAHPDLVFVNSQHAVLIEQKDGQSDTKLITRLQREEKDA